MCLCNLAISVNTIINPGTYFGRHEKHSLAIFHHQTHTTGPIKWAWEELFWQHQSLLLRVPLTLNCRRNYFSKEAREKPYPTTYMTVVCPLFFRAAQTVVSELPVADSMASGSKNWVLFPCFHKPSTPSPDLGFSWVQLGATKLSNACESPSHARRWWPDLLKNADTEGWPSTPSTDKSKGTSHHMVSFHGEHAEENTCQYKEGGKGKELDLEEPHKSMIKRKKTLWAT